MGEALKSHAKSSKHVSLSTGKKSHVVKPVEAPCVENETDTSSSNANTQKSSIASFVSDENVLEAEMLWAFWAVPSHFSSNSCEKISALFQGMFKDSEIAKKVSCGKDKVSYLCIFGLGTYFLQQIKDKMTRPDGFVLMFDESLNRDLDKKKKNGFTCPDVEYGQGKI
ncbi:peptidase m20 domain-containing protein 2 [Plakobranchus ocellatus]|uniref:Peptidase m20 domain-containing protein 2 n=1 Tax=Plakobranchus ocellatus TaxID=259542 RepID=A0AAV4BTY3_9GAST|nr:peptidase m20 domain-containing protein 2 [Plakobranchus ocellatus]